MPQHVHRTSSAAIVRWSTSTNNCQLKWRSMGRHQGKRHFSTSGYSTPMPLPTITETWKPLQTSWDSEEERIWPKDSRGRTWHIYTTGPLYKWGYVSWNIHLQEACLRHCHQEKPRLQHSTGLALVQNQLCAVALCYHGHQRHQEHCLHYHNWYPPSCQRRRSTTSLTFVYCVFD